MWELYVPGMLKRGEWVSAWDSIAEEPFFAKFEPDSNNRKYGDFVNLRGDQVGEEVVTHIMRIKAPKGKQGHWEYG